MIYIWIFLLASIRGILGLTLSVCSTNNLGTYSTSSNMMSNGLCYDSCKSNGYAVAIVQHFSCYCSNYVPSDTSDMSNCAEECPGYGYESCASQGYYGYILITTPSGTEGLSSASSTTYAQSTSVEQVSTSSTAYSWSPSSSSTSSTSIIHTPSSSQSSSAGSTSSTRQSTTSSSSQTYSQTTSARSSSSGTPSSTVSSSTLVSSTRSSSTSSSSISSSTDSSSSASSSSLVSSRSSELYSSSSIFDTSSTSSEAPNTIYVVETVGGEASRVVSTEYVTAYPSSSISSISTSIATSDPVDTNRSKASSSKSNSFFDSTGKVAGTFTAVGIVVVGLIMVLFYFCCIKKRSDADDDDDDYSNDEEFLDVDDKDLKSKPAYFVTNPSSNSSNGHKRSFSYSSSNIKRNESTKSMLSFLAPSSGAGAQRTLSRKKLNERNNDNDQIISNEMMFPINESDPRLNPSSMFLNNNTSKKSLADEIDYSRPILKIVNPDS